MEQYQRHDFASESGCRHFGCTLLPKKVFYYRYRLYGLGVLGQDQHTKMFFGALHKFNARTQKYECCFEGDLKLNAAKKDYFEAPGR
ncbi:hypothetical protein KP509_05G008500 [Ceratopteris richardii]|uniref:Uncharacterized protein n=1 Tax=Ceratopteris richardii TaxID=49495 RepID=A0A8T2US52_CERRI|nr:hypothetical protein KP509_05G008500 [Ceratopteris richardii]